MKLVNLCQIIDTWKSLNPNLFKKYQSYAGIGKAQGGLREDELKDLECFVDCCRQYSLPVNKLNGFYVGYSIPQIGKEFDLLRFGDNFTLNIEIKHLSIEEKIEQQLLRNQYYLKFADKAPILFTFVAISKELYHLDGKHIKKVEFQKLIDTMSCHQLATISNIDNLFDPTNYLVSPFNSTKKFLSNEYFLTKQQEEIKNKVMCALTTHSQKYMAITGAAGTGKTLLTYDIAKSAIASKNRVLILHFAQYNEGQQLLINKYNWPISQTRYGLQKDFSDYDIIIVDEAQRATPYQCDSIIKKVSESQAICVFSFDGKQCLRNQESLWDTPKKIISLGVVPFMLTNKIRTNKEIAYFIKRLFDLNTKSVPQKISNVSISFCANYITAKSILSGFSESTWKVPRYTPSNRSSFHYEKYGVEGEDCAHSIIGQEYDQVVGVIDNHFYYDENGRLQSKEDKYYSQRQMLFQILTRTRKKLHILVIDNTEVFEKCIDILSQ